MQVFRTNFVQVQLTLGGLHQDLIKVFRMQLKGVFCCFHFWSDRASLTIVKQVLMTLTLNSRCKQSWFRQWQRIAFNNCVFFCIRNSVLLYGCLLTNAVYVLALIMSVILVCLLWSCLSPRIVLPNFVNLSNFYITSNLFAFNHVSLVFTKFSRRTRRFWCLSQRFQTLLRIDLIENIVFKNLD